LREVVEIVGIEGLQDSDRLLMNVAERIRTEFLCQNAYSEDAFSAPESTQSKIKDILNYYALTEEKLNGGASLDEMLRMES
jgi:V/A-type H+-transporting ATPase subunit A